MKMTTTLFHELECQKAEVFQSTIRPAYAPKQAKEVYSAFGIVCPTEVKRKGNELEFIYEDEQPSVNKAVAFTRKPSLTDEQIEGLRAQKALPEGTEANSSNEKNTSQIKNHSTGKQPGHRGRSKSQETLDIEAEVAAEGSDPSTPEGKKRVMQLKRERKFDREGKQPRHRGRPQESRDS